MSRDAQTVTFQVPHPPNALRPNRRAAHWATRDKAADAYSAEVWFGWCEGSEVIDLVLREVNRPLPRDKQPKQAFPWDKARVVYTWKYAGVAPDLDNIAGALKCLQDTLCMSPPPNKRSKPKRDRWYLGLIENDTAIEAEFKREKVAHKSDECVVVRIERMRG